MNWWMMIVKFLTNKIIPCNYPKLNGHLYIFINKYTWSFFVFFININAGKWLFFNHRKVVKNAKIDVFDQLEVTLIPSLEFQLLAPVVGNFFLKKLWLLENEIYFFKNTPKFGCWPDSETQARPKFLVKTQTCRNLAEVPDSNVCVYIYINLFAFFFPLFLLLSASPFLLLHETRMKKKLKYSKHMIYIFKFQIFRQKFPTIEKSCWNLQPLENFG